MKKIGIAIIITGFFCSYLHATDAEFSNCVDYCDTLSGKRFIDGTPAEACNTGCYAAHWQKEEAAIKKCYAKHKGRADLIMACKEGVRHYR